MFKYIYLFIFQQLICYKVWFPKECAGRRSVFSEGLKQKQINCLILQVMGSDQTATKITISLQFTRRDFQGIVANMICANDDDE